MDIKAGDIVHHKLDNREMLVLCYSMATEYDWVCRYVDEDSGEYKEIEVRKIELKEYEGN